MKISIITETHNKKEMHFIKLFNECFFTTQGPFYSLTDMKEYGQFIVDFVDNKRVIEKLEGKG